MGWVQFGSAPSHLVLFGGALARTGGGGAVWLPPGLPACLPRMNEVVLQTNPRLPHTSPPHRWLFASVLATGFSVLCLYLFCGVLLLLLLVLALVAVLVLLLFFLLLLFFFSLCLFFPLAVLFLLLVILHCVRLRLLYCVPSLPAVQQNKYIHFCFVF